MKIKKLRTLNLGDRVTSLRFAPADWEAIETAATRAGQTWSDWARDILRAGKGDRSQTALLRRAANEWTDVHPMLAERIDDLAAAREFDHPMLNQRFWALDSEAVAAELEIWDVSRRVEFAAFELIVGLREGHPALIVRSRLEDDLNALLLRDAHPDDADESGCLTDDVAG